MLHREREEEGDWVVSSCSRSKHALSLLFSFLLFSSLSVIFVLVIAFRSLMGSFTPYALGC